MISTWTKEERFGLQISIVFHLLLFLVLYAIQIEAPQEQRTAFIEVELGAFQMGSPAEFSNQQNQNLKTRRNVSNQESNNVSDDANPNQQNTRKSVDRSKQVDATDQVLPVESDDIVKTPDTEKIDTELSSKQQEKQETVAPKAKQAQENMEGAEETGSVEGLQGDVNVQDGTGTDEDKSAPYSLKWEGDIDRSPQIKPMPSFNEQLEAIITVRFQVRPDGTVGRMIPQKKMNPDLEREILKTLKKWRFTRLPSGVPQKGQWGTITFRFILE